MGSTFAPWGEEEEYLVGTAGCVLVLKCAPCVFAAAGPSCSQHKADGVPGTLWAAQPHSRAVFWWVRHIVARHISGYTDMWIGGQGHVWARRSWGLRPRPDPPWSTLLGLSLAT